MDRRELVRAGLDAADLDLASAFQKGKAIVGL
jgi:hypothetical protein